MKVGDCMQVTNAYSSAEVKTQEMVAEANSREKTKNEKEYANYLMEKYACLTPGKNASVSITSGLLRKAMNDEETSEWLERELSKAPDYIKEAQQSALARGSTLKFVSIEFGEEYSTMCVCTVTDGGGKDPDIEKWLERIKEKKAEKKENEKKLEHKKLEEKAIEKADKDVSYQMVLKGKDLESLTNQFSLKLSMAASEQFTSGYFDIKG